VGPLLARRLGRDFLDADLRIEEEAGQSVAGIFEERGEAAFRALEAAAIDEAAAGSAVVALGGGAVAKPGAARRLASLGTVVYLRASPDTLLSRIGPARGRPLLAGLDAGARRRRLLELLAEREGAYESAEIVVDTDGQSPEAVADRIVERLATP
jgi:shikimate kinase